MTLDFARSHPVEAGSNRRGDQADTTWLFLLPSLELREVVIMGAAPAGTLVALRALAHRVIVAPPRALPPGTPDLVYVAPSRAKTLARDGRALARLGDVLEAGGSVYIGARARRSAPEQAALARRLGIEACVSIGPPSEGPELMAPDARSAWLIPAAPWTPPPWTRRVVGAIRAASRLLRRVARRTSTAGPVRVSELEGSVGVHGIGALPPKPPPATGALLRSSGGAGAPLLPDFLARAAEAGGARLRASGWRLAPPRGYRSQKVIFFTKLDDGTRLVVKLTQDPRFNPPLENEAAALAMLADVDIGNALSAPELRFRSMHAGLVVVGQTALQGRAFVHVAGRQDGPDHAEAVVHGLRTLARATKQPGGDVAEALLEIIGRYRALYGLATHRARRLEGHARVLGEMGAELPAVFMHGDATVYNTLVGPDSRIGLVDWENAEPAGLPLWDLFQFEQAHAVWTAERSGLRYTPGMFLRQFLDDSGSVSASPAVLASSQELGVPDAATEPLMYMWLAWHAVREARQLDPARLAHGFYHRVLGSTQDG